VRKKKEKEGIKALIEPPKPTLNINISGNTRALKDQLRIGRQSAAAFAAASVSMRDFASAFHLSQFKSLAMRMVLFDGPFHGEIREAHGDRLEESIVLVKTPEVMDYLPYLLGKGPDPLDLPIWDHHQYRLKRVFNDKRAALYVYQGPY